MTDGIIDSQCDDLEPHYEGSRYTIHPAGALGLFDTVEAIAWAVADPHERLATTTSEAIGIFAFGHECEALVADALRRAGNRVLGRNMAQAEGISALMLSAGREALGHFEDAQCVMAHQTMRTLDDPSFNVEDG